MVDLKKDSASISLELRGIKLSGVVTDSHLLCFYSFFFLEDEERRQLETKGSDKLLDIVQERQRRMLEDLRQEKITEFINKNPGSNRNSVAAKVEKEVVEAFDKRIAETLFWKVNNNYKIQTEVAIRILLIFPSIDRSLVFYDPRLEIGGMSLTSKEIMTLIMSILGGLMDMTYEAPEPAKEKVKTEAIDPTPEPGSAILVEPVKQENPFGLSDEDLKHLSAEAKAKLGIA